MEESYKKKMEALGYDQLVCEIFGDWENVKDEILLPDRKSGSGNGTVHVFLGAADSFLRDEFASYYEAVEGGEDPSVKAVEVKHYFLPSNVLSMVGFVCRYLHQKGNDFTATVNSILNTLAGTTNECGLISTESYFKLSVGSSKLRPYFKQFSSDGLFMKLIRLLLLPESAYKISLFKNAEGKYAAFWLIGFDWMGTFDSDSSSSFITRPIPDDYSDIYKNVFAALRTKPFLLLAGISGTGKSRIVRELAFRSCPAKLQDTDGTTPGNYLMVEVKPNWHDSTELLGYYSNISGSYRFTKFIDFLVLAHQNLDTPFFVCLDEMNLAPVEQYFAEFLSVLETRRYPKGDNTHIKTGSLVDKKYMESYPGWEMGQDLTLPDNVFIIGTVNMDDTTHQFSRKVIDRAMTIEMNGGELDKMFESSDNLKYTGEWSLADFKPVYVQANEVLARHGGNSIKTDAPSKLEAINACLKGTPFEVSYRVLNELCIYIAVLLDSGMDYDTALSKAVDQITLMKILPRIEGDEDMFRIPKEDKNRLQKLQELFTADTDTFKKLSEMIARLDNGFTRFWP